MGNNSFSDIQFKAFSESPLIIAGPCSAESEEQLYRTTKELKKAGIRIIRAGVWKPRTRPGNFEGAGTDALKWIQNIKAELGVMFATEVATADHVEKALKSGIDILWIGARTTANPFAIQEVANALEGVEKPVMVKNPLHPDISLWLGALERISKSGITNLAAVHRGFASFQKSVFRNPPTWHIAIELKSKAPELPMICDPSHIAGNREMIADICQKALDLGYNGLMIESHIQPEKALSDADQQVTPSKLKSILSNLEFRKQKSDDAFFLSRLDALREKIDHVDQELIDALTARMKLVNEIGEYKKENNVAVFQVERWKEILETRSNWGNELGMDEEFIKKLYAVIHEESIRQQTNILNAEPSKFRHDS